MYIGSVRFFKHIFYTLICIILFIPTIFAIVFYCDKNSAENDSKKALNSLEIVQKDYDELLSVGPSLDDFCDAILENDYSTQEILDVFEKHNIDFAKDVFLSQVLPLPQQQEYSLLYEDLYSKYPSEFNYEENTVYLTFDNGPSDITLLVLSILDKYNIKATFFVTNTNYNNSDSILRSIVKKGHSIGILSYSNDYENIYSSVESYLDDFNKMYTHIFDVTGVKTKVFRFPNGSINNDNTHIYKQIIAEMTRRGFVYYDWNVSAQDLSDNQVDWTTIYKNVTNGMKDKDRAIISMQDSAEKIYTTLTLEDIILYLIDNDFGFKPITNDVEPIVFGYLN